MAFVFFCHLYLTGLAPAETITPLEDISGANGMDKAASSIRELLAKYPPPESSDSVETILRENKSLNRRELLMLLNGLIHRIQDDQASISSKVDLRDVQILNWLQESFKEELYAINLRRHALEARATAMESKNEEAEQRLSLLERSTVHGDAVLGLMADRASGGVEPGDDGIRDSITAMGRLRLTVDAPVKEDAPDSMFGTGVLSTRLIGAFGRYAPNQVQNGSLGAVYPFNLYSRVTSDVGAFNEGLSTGGNTPYFSGGTNVRTSLYMESLFYRQHVKTALPFVSRLLGAKAQDSRWQSSGDFYLGVIRWWDLFDVSPYRGNELTQFQNNAFINIPGIAVNVAQPMVGYQLHQGLGENFSMDVSAASGSSTVGTLLSALQTSYEVRFNAMSGFLGSYLAKPASLYVGGYTIVNAGNADSLKESIAGIPNRSGGEYRNFLNDKPGQAVYVGWNQEWYKGIGSSVGYLYNNDSGNIVAYTTLQPGPATRLAGARQGFNSVLYMPVNTFTDKLRPKDAMGIGYAFLDIHKGGLSGNRYNNSLEQVVEAFYRYQLSDTCAIIPSAQLIMGRLGLKGNSPDTVLSIRASYTF